MNYNVKGTGLQVSEEIRNYIEKRLVHVDVFLKNDKTAHVDVEVEHQTSEGRKKYRAEFTLQTMSNVFRAEAVGDTLHEALDIASDELTLELRRSKKKHLRLIRNGAVKFKEFMQGFRDRF